MPSTTRAARAGSDQAAPASAAAAAAAKKSKAPHQRRAAAAHHDSSSDDIELDTELDQGKHGADVVIPDSEEDDRQPQADGSSGSGSEDEDGDDDGGGGGHAAHGRRAMMQQQRQRQRRVPASSSGDEDDATDASGDDGEDEEAAARGGGRAQAAARRPARGSGSGTATAAAPVRGRSGAAAAAATTSTRGRKRSAAQAELPDPIALLPSGLDEEALIRARQQLPPRNRIQKQALLQAHRQQFPRWRFLLRQRFSLLFYGFGSKRPLLELFAHEALTDGGVLAVDGLAAGMSSKQVLQAAASALTHRSCKSHSHRELLSLIETEPACRQLYLVLHNIDGPGLRSPEDQLWLSRLCRAPAVRLLASVDHVNAALLWDSRLAAAFNWLWVEATSYAGYEEETRHVAPIITSCKQSAAKRGATTVLSTLVSSAREVFKLLAGQQLEEPSAPGVGFPQLLRLVREAFVLNSEQALKSVLAEFRDHELIKLRPGADGGEVMYIPMEPALLQRALADMEGGGGGGGAGGDGA